MLRNSYQHSVDLHNRLTLLRSSTSKWPAIGLSGTHVFNIISLTMNTTQTMSAHMHDNAERHPGLSPSSIPFDLFVHKIIFYFFKNILFCPTYYSFVILGLPPKCYNTDRIQYCAFVQVTSVTLTRLYGFSSSASKWWIFASVRSFLEGL